MNDSKPDAPPSAFGFSMIVSEAAQGINPGALMVVFALGPRTFASDHITCVECNGAENCRAVQLCETAIKYADDAGHPEWVDGDEPLME